MPKKKVNPAEEPEQTTGLMGQAEEELPAPLGEPPQDTGALDGPLPISGDNHGPPEDGEGVAGGWARRGGGLAAGRGSRREGVAAVERESGLGERERDRARGV